MAPYALRMQMRKGKCNPHQCIAAGTARGRRSGALTQLRMVQDQRLQLALVRLACFLLLVWFLPYIHNTVRLVHRALQAKARMAQAHTAATRLLSAFQAQGYEVAAGLDSLQVRGPTALECESAASVLLCAV